LYQLSHCDDDDDLG